MSIVTKAAHPDRFDITADGEESAAGSARFVDHDGARIFFHTVVDDAYAGQGLGRTLVAAALDATRAEGLRIVPMCPFVAKLVELDTAWSDIIDEVTPEAAAAVEGRQRG